MIKLARRFLQIGQSIPSLPQIIIVSGINGQYNIQLKRRDSAQYFSGKKIVLVGFPGAFTPTCSEKHLPAFVELNELFKEKGVQVVGLSVNDPFVLQEFGEEIGGELKFIADGGADLTSALDAGIDLTDKGLGFRTRRFTALVEDGKIVQLNDENGPGFTDLSSADTILKSL